MQETEEHDPAKLDLIIRKSDLPKFCGLRRSQIDHYIQQGTFPKPVPIGQRARGWLSSELRRWQLGLIAARDEKGGA